MVIFNFFCASFYFSPVLIYRLYFFKIIIIIRSYLFWGDYLFYFMLLYFFNKSHVYILWLEVSIYFNFFFRFFFVLIFDIRILSIPKLGSSFLNKYLRAFNSYSFLIFSFPLFPLYFSYADS